MIVSAANLKKIYHKLCEIWELDHAYVATVEDNPTPLDLYPSDYIHSSEFNSDIIADACPWRIFNTLALMQTIRDIRQNKICISKASFIDHFEKKLYIDLGALYREQFLLKKITSLASSISNLPITKETEQTQALIDQYLNRLRSTPNGPALVEMWQQQISQHPVKQTVETWSHVHKSIPSKGTLRQANAALHKNKFSC